MMAQKPERKIVAITPKMQFLSRWWARKDELTTELQPHIPKPNQLIVSPEYLRIKSLIAECDTALTTEKEPETVVETNQTL